MAKLTGGRRILTEDFSTDDQELIQRLAFVLNPFLEQTINAFSKNITITENLNMEYKTIQIEVDGSGKVTTTSRFQTDILNTTGVIVVNHRVLTSGASPYPTTAPYVTFTRDSNILKIQHVTGLTAGVKYELTLLILGA